MRNPLVVMNNLKSFANRHGYKYKRLYRNLYNQEFFLLAYNNIYSKPGNMTAGTDGKTIDGMNLDRINKIIISLKTGKYKPDPAKRKYINKRNGKKRPLGIPSIKKTYNGTKWFVEGDIKACFDNIDHHVLIKILRRRIKDEQFIGLIWKFLKAGYLENWEYNITNSGTPQGSIISPILANIYLNELDKYMME